MRVHKGYDFILFATDLINLDRGMGGGKRKTRGRSLDRGMGGGKRSIVRRGMVEEGRRGRRSIGS